MAANRASIHSTNRPTAKVRRVASSSVKKRVKPGRKVQSLRVPPGKIIKAQAMLVEGHSQREIGRTLHMSAHTVGKVVKREDFVHHITEMQERLFAIAPIAIQSFQARVATDGILAYTFLKDLGISPSPEAMARLFEEATPADAGIDRQCQMVAAVLLESHKNFGVDLPENVKAALAKDSREQQAAKTSQPKLLRK
jgi:hypothetical protein